MGAAALRTRSACWRTPRATCRTPGLLPMPSPCSLPMPSPCLLPMPSPWFAPNAVPVVRSQCAVLVVGKGDEAALKVGTSFELCSEALRISQGFECR